jgi:hypothetical protein
MNFVGFAKVEQRKEKAKDVTSVIVVMIICSEE